MTNIPQIYCAVAVSFINLTLGTSYGWATLIPKMEKDKDLPYELSVEDIRWLGKLLINIFYSIKIIDLYSHFMLSLLPLETLWFFLSERY